MSKIKLAIFASGSGTNAQRLVEYFSDHEHIEVASILSNKKDAFVLERAARLGVPSSIFGREDLYRSSRLLDQLAKDQIDYIILAGFLWLIPSTMVERYPNKIINIHPALLPAFGGKGMYGAKVHEAVVNNGEWRSGITIHLVNEAYDEGAVLAQEECMINTTDTAETLAQKIHQLEYAHFPLAVEKYVLSQSPSTAS
ncbi:MAG: phosphoribosylglycinamide formyltransferase [Cyclobacteriaceae bacterium]